MNRIYLYHYFCIEKSATLFKWVKLNIKLNFREFGTDFDIPDFKQFQEIFLECYDDNSDKKKETKTGWPIISYLSHILNIFFITLTEKNTFKKKQFYNTISYLIHTIWAYHLSQTLLSLSIHPPHRKFHWKNYIFHVLSAQRAYTVETTLNMLWNYNIFFSIHSWIENVDPTTYIASSSLFFQIIYWQNESPK